MKSSKDNCSQLILNEPFLVQKEGESIFKQLKQDNETVYYLPYDPSTETTTTTTTEVKENTKPLNCNKNKRKRYTPNCPYKKPLLKLQDTTRTLKLLKKYRAQQTLESCTTQWRSVAEEASDKLLKYIKEMSHPNAEGGGGGGDVKWTVKKMFQSMRMDVTLLELSSSSSSSEEEEEEEESEQEE